MFKVISEGMLVSSPVDSTLLKKHPGVNVMRVPCFASTFLECVGGLHKLLDRITNETPFSHDGKSPILYAIGKFKSLEPFYEGTPVERVAALKARKGGFSDYQGKEVCITIQEVLSSFDIFLTFKEGRSDQFVYFEIF